MRRRPGPDAVIGVLNSSGAEAAARDLAEITHFLPAHAGRGEHNALGQAIAPIHLHFGATDVEHGYLHLVFWAAIVRVVDAVPVGDHLSALERGAALGKNGEQLSGRYIMVHG